MMTRRSSLSTASRKRWEAVTALALMTLMITATVLTLRPAAFPTSTGSGLTFSSMSCSSIITQAAINATVSDAYSSAASSGIPTSTWPPQPTVDSTIWGAYTTSICPQVNFQNLVTTLGAQNLSLELFGSNYSGTSSQTTPLTTGFSGTQFANFTFDWFTMNATALATNIEWWSVNLTSASVAGPLTLPVSGPPMYVALNPLHSWGGYTWYVPGSTKPQTLVNETSWTYVPGPGAGGFTAPSCTTPPNCQTSVPANVSVHPMASVWTGLATTVFGADPGRGGQVYLAGYGVDTNNTSGLWCTGYNYGCDYGVWWSFTTAHAPQPVIPFTHTKLRHEHVNPGDLVVENVSDSFAPCSGGVYWDAKVLDVTTRAFWVHPRCMEFSPSYAPMMYEAPNATTNLTSPHYITQQTPSFSSITFYSAALTTSSGAFVPVVNLFPAPTGSGSFVVDTVTEYPPPTHTNTAESLILPCGPSFSPSIPTSCQTTTWYNSLYDYAYV